MSVAASSASVDYASLVTNLGIFTAFIVATVVGVWRGLKKIRKDESSQQVAPRDIAAATILENATLSEWSRSNHEVIIALAELRRAMYNNCECLKDQGRDMKELGHQIERLRDKIG